MEILMDLESTNGAMVKENLLGLTEDFLKEITKMIKNMDKVPLSGVTAGNILEDGTKGNNMAKGFILMKKEKKRKELGPMGRDLLGIPRGLKLLIRITATKENFSFCF